MRLTSAGGAAFAIAILAIYFGFLLLGGVGFYRLQNLYGIAYSVAIVAPAVIAMQLLLVTGNFDLSLGSNAALSGVISALVASATGSAVAGLLGAVLIGLGAGYLNGVLVVRLGINSLIATVATMGALHTAALVLSGGGVAGGLPLAFERPARLELLHLELPVLLTGILAGGLTWLSSNLLAFRRLYQVGSNQKAAELSGINVCRTQIAGFVICGIGGALTGYLGASRTMSASPIAFGSLALDSIVACVIGGGTLSGGRGTVIGAIAGCLIVQVTENATLLYGISIYWRDLAVAIILILAIVARRSSETRSHAARSRGPFSLS